MEKNVQEEDKRKINRREYQRRIVRTYVRRVGGHKCLFFGIG